MVYSYISWNTFNTTRIDRMPQIQRHDDVIKWKHFPRYWPFVRGIHRSPVNSPHKALVFSLICVWINGWVNNCEAGDLRRYRAHCDVTVMVKIKRLWCYNDPNLQDIKHSLSWLAMAVIEMIATELPLSQRLSKLPYISSIWVNALGVIGITLKTLRPDISGRHFEDAISNIFSWK